MRLIKFFSGLFGRGKNGGSSRQGDVSDDNYPMF